MFDLGAFLFFLGFGYYIISMLVGVCIMEDNISNSSRWIESSAIFKIWGWIAIVFLWVPFLYTPFRIILFLINRKAQKHFFTVLMSTFKKEATI